jgi:hypothetical protein
MNAKKPKPQKPKSQLAKFGFEAPPAPRLVISKTKLKKKTVRKIIEAVEKL